MDLKTFTAAAEAALDAIPEEYLEGVVGLVVEDRAEEHPTLPGIYTLGVCATESYLSEYVSADTTHSTIVLFYGSFAAMAEGDPSFDWEAEIQETVEHEVKHHLEALAGEDDLGGVDYAMDESFKRDQGLDFDPWFWEHGSVAGRGVRVVEDQVFIEQPWSEKEFRQVEELEVSWQGRRYAVPRPGELGDVHFILLEGISPEPPTVELVLTRRRGWRDRAGQLLSGAPPVVILSAARVRPLDRPLPE